MQWDNGVVECQGDALMVTSNFETLVKLGRLYRSVVIDAECWITDNPENLPLFFIQAEAERSL